MNNYPEEIKNLEPLFRSKYNSMIVENIIDLCFNGLNPTQARFNESTDIKIAHCFMKFSEALKRI